MKALRHFCVGFGMAHVVIMTIFARGEDPAPIAVLAVDAPVALLTRSIAPHWLALGIPIAVCTILYPSLIYLGGTIVGNCIKKYRSASSTL